jgi:3-hydroxyisobutyrate dehydrogenase-like beta-hydroxyacid dehydrogenase
MVLKDIDLMLALARAQGVAMPLTAMTRQLMQMLVGAGMGDEDYLAAIKFAEAQAGLRSDRVD